VTLTPHPTSPAGPIRAVAVLLEREGGDVRLRFTAVGRIDEVRWPPAGRGRADDLWRHTCFEAFVQTDDGYVEFNLSPSGQWASYRFDAPRQGMREAIETVEAIAFNRSKDGAELAARLTLPGPYGPFPAFAGMSGTFFGLSAVIEAVDGTSSYWALAHPSDKPDFHHPHSFTLELP